MKVIKFPLLILGIVAAGFIIFLHSCKSETENSFITHPYQFPDIPWFPTNMNIPADNPTTVEGVRLGRYLFYDGRWPGRLEADSQMSCGTCHLQKNSFVCGIDHPKYIGGHPFGVTGIMTPHYMMPFINLVYHQNGYLWNGVVNNQNPALGNSKYGAPAVPHFNMRNIETLVWMGFYAPHEMNCKDTARAINTIMSIPYPDYKKLFRDAFGSELINMERIGKAIAQYVRTLISYNSRYDSVMHLHLKKFTPSEARGYQVFYTETGDCFHCHGDPALLTNTLYMNNGLDTVFNDLRDRGHYTLDSMDYGAYKVPTLRNIALRAPYMRDGRFKTLEEVIEYYSTGVKLTKYTNSLMKYADHGGVGLNEGQKEDLLAFLKTLTDYKFVSDTAFSRPSDLP